MFGLVLCKMGGFPRNCLLLPQGHVFVASCVLESSSSGQDGPTKPLEVPLCHILLAERWAENAAQSSIISQSLISSADWLSP